MQHPSPINHNLAKGADLSATFTMIAFKDCNPAFNLAGFPIQYVL